MEAPRMQDIIARLRAGKKNDEGFTLIELLVVVVIIGVLVAIAVPVYLNYRQGAADKSAQSDVRGAISAVEQYYTNNGNKFPASKSEETGDAKVLELPPLNATGGAKATITLSDKTKLAYYKVDEKSYRICATNTGGSDKYFLYDSTAGGSVSDAGKVLTLATCS
ncbi:prepilin-type N-terminal cleavage/methylation domain-containing protein [Actinoplanes sp. NEAU-A12]|uniref:Prepilin-type N-terminal cleavage/methylation domain-containing protein n=1 Tax=Actinoplanes sandaracinus TaxID=3045177 RepID=A0ABT6WZX6_9ACTN|nr:prepilin-type N-terminal cleavage/methylation domain-containing protein [Actinoplanes sandaracinus]MDI6105317.1 prepilin-type N-terminal cleavage/methylation domain-containing protein [Actinoplanes sandaracinus]